MKEDIRWDLGRGSVAGGKERKKERVDETPLRPPLKNRGYFSGFHRLDIFSFNYQKYN